MSGGFCPADGEGSVRTPCDTDRLCSVNSTPPPPHTYLTCYFYPLLIFLFFYPLLFLLRSFLQSLLHVCALQARWDQYCVEMSFSCIKYTYCSISRSMC